MESSVKQLARLFHLDMCIHLLGGVSDIIPIIKNFSASVLCSESEGMSNAIIEYMGCGTPIVCTNVGGNPELIEDGHNGFLIEVGDIEALSERLIKILTDRSLASRLGHNAQCKVSQVFLGERMVNSYMQLYEEQWQCRSGGL